MAALNFFTSLVFTVIVAGLAMPMTLDDLQSTHCPVGTTLCVFDGSCCRSDSQFCDQQIRTCNNVFPAGADPLRLCCDAALGQNITSQERLNSCYFRYGMTSLLDRCSDPREAAYDVYDILMIVLIVLSVGLNIIFLICCLKIRKCPRPRSEEKYKNGIKPKEGAYGKQTETADLMGSSSGTLDQSGEEARTAAAGGVFPTTNDNDDVYEIVPTGASYKHQSVAQTQEIA
ncbi:uncharacterized protein LOC131930132 isoform X2 [Physella acuta]|uniref:uncharacterized protein LOC131930132 isoform X2 n=1 Tax=Physella acuta TaxID=109671 RepID=UPI0027DE3BCF|nr:uncharacterized protein LOC131930132 isoform X2 [Physella acuta]